MTDLTKAQRAALYELQNGKNSWDGIHAGTRRALLRKSAVYFGKELCEPYTVKRQWGRREDQWAYDTRHVVEVRDYMGLGLGVAWLHGSLEGTTEWDEWNKKFSWQAQQEVKARS